MIIFYRYSFNDFLIGRWILAKREWFGRWYVKWWEKELEEDIREEKERVERAKSSITSSSLSGDYHVERIPLTKVSADLHHWFLEEDINLQVMLSQPCGEVVWSRYHVILLREQCSCLEIVEDLWSVRKACLVCTLCAGNLKEDRVGQRRLPERLMLFPVKHPKWNQDER